jgi:hypothetical protein
MKEQIKIAAGFIILAAIVLGGGAYFLKPVGANPLGSLGVDFAQFTQCVTDKGWQEYGASWCAHCQELKADIGNAWKLLKYNECGNQEKECLNKNIEGFPTFLGLDAKTGTTTSVVGYAGWSTLEELAFKTGCVLPAKN